METGYSIPNTGMYGCLTRPPDFFHTPLTGSGYLPRMGGPGFPTINGDGHHFTTEGGSSILSTDRCGSPVTTGARDGWSGADPVITTAGRRWVPESDMRLSTEGTIIFPITAGDLSGTGISEDRIFIITISTIRPI